MGNKGRYGLLLLGCLLLCQCAVKHQPQVFEPYFHLKPEGHFSVELLSEREALRSLSNPSRLQKKRLLQLYQAEQKTLAPSNYHYERLDEEIRYLQSDIESEDEPVGDLGDQIKEQVTRHRASSRSDKRRSLTSGDLKRAYDVAYQLWNQNENLPALAQVTELLSKSDLIKEASEDEIYLIYYLKFRISIDVAQLAVAEHAYQKLKEIDDCDSHTSTAAFLLALSFFGNEANEKAKGLLLGQCETDQSVEAKQKKEYWLARFSESELGDKGYQNIFRGLVPDYYLYMSLLRRGKKLKFPSEMMNAKTYLTKELSLSSEIADLIRKAEERIGVGLRSEARRLLRLASLKLRFEPEVSRVPALLYVAHLSQAAGYQLEAFRIYSTVFDIMKESDDEAAVPFDFIHEVYPRPFQAEVESASMMWGVDPDLVYALMRQESAFNPEAHSSAGARGLLQLMPFLAENLSEQWRAGPYYSEPLLFHGDENIRWSVFHLNQLQAIAPHLALVAASYNAGYSRTSRWWERFGHLPLDVFIELIPVRETRKYVKIVIRNFLYYKAQREEGLVRLGWLPFKLPPYRLSSFSE